MNNPPSQTALIDWLQVPSHFGDNITQVTLIQTHISCVFLTGKYAFKLKKAVKFEFLDFSLADDRQHFCALEIALNKRTAPELYLEVITLFWHPVLQTWSLQQDCATQAEWQAVDYLVKMRQFDPNQVLSRAIQQQPLNDDQIKLLAQQIADFHLHAEVITPPSAWGSAEAVIAPMTANFPSLTLLFEQLIHQRAMTPEMNTRLQRLAQHTQAQHTLLAPLITQRQEQGFVRACHGDLHLDNITIYNHKLVLFDGIEFNEQFRLIDVISDLAFLLTDLDFKGASLTSKKILNHYLIATGDYLSLALLNFYQTYRAMVRAKITGLRYEQLEPGTAEAKQTLAQVLGYLELAENYAFPKKQAPKLVVMQGISGSGKSYLAAKLAEETGAIWINSDRERKRHFGIAMTERVSGMEQSKLYSPLAHQTTYELLHAGAAAGLQSGRNVIVDATFLKAQSRHKFIRLAQTSCADYALVSITPNPKRAAQRIADRLKAQIDPSDATLEVMQQQINQFEAPTQDEPAFIFNTDNPEQTAEWQHLITWLIR